MQFNAIYSLIDNYRRFESSKEIKYGRICISRGAFHIAHYHKISEQNFKYFPVVQE